MTYTSDEIVYAGGEPIPDKYITWGKLQEVLSGVSPDVKLRCNPVTRNLILQWPDTLKHGWVDFAEETLCV